MALIPIMGQPVNLFQSPEQEFCNPVSDYCVIHGMQEDEDFIKFMMKQTPCGDSVVGNGDFTDGSVWTMDANVIIADGKATHTPGTAGAIYQDVLSTFVITNYFKVKFTVTGLSAGNIEVQIGSTGATYTITSNGFYEYWTHSLFENDYLIFYFSADCYASISDVSFYKMLDETEIVGTLIDSSGYQVAALSVSLHDEFILFYYPTFGMTEGCYTVTVVDQCQFALNTFTEAFTDNLFNNPPDWSVVGGGLTANISGGTFNVITGAGPSQTGIASQPINVPYGLPYLYYCEFKTGTIQSTGNISAGIYFDSSEFFSALPIAPNTTYYKFGVYSANYFDVSMLEQEIYLQLHATPSAGEVNELLSVSFKTIAASLAVGVFTSNCLKVMSDVSGTKLVEGFADLINTYPLPSRSLGFGFNTQFWLRARLPIQFSNPHSPTKTENYLYSNGNKKKIYAQVGKAWDLTFLEVDENMHDTIANIINCDHFKIEGVEYISEEKEYSPNWNFKSQLSIADSKIEVQKIDGTRFNTND